MKLRKFLALCLSLCMVLSLAPIGTFAAETGEDVVTDLAIEVLDGSDYDVNLTVTPDVSDNVIQAEPIDPNAGVKVIIVMEEESVIEQDASAVVSDETMELVEQLEAAQADVVAEIEEIALEGESLEISYNYTWLLNGVAAEVPYGTIEAIEAIDGVKKVMIQQVYSVCETDTAAASPMTVTDGVMIGRESAWATGYTGEGMKIAIIDTGLDTDHQNFAALDEEKLTDTSASAENVEAVLANLNAAARYQGLTVEDVYYSTKVVYGFNYCDNDLDITHANDSMGDHGTHVAGIAAANKVETSEVVGVAPDAQLYVMKVFGKNGGAYAMDILAALEDAVMLGADVINMSLGSPAGFTSGDLTELGDPLDDFYNAVSETGTVLAVSAGNNYNSAQANLWGTNANLTMYPDDGVLGSPGSYANTMTVASVENWMVQENYIDADGYHITYVDSTDFGLPAMTTLTGEYEFVVIPGTGDVADYEGLDVTGKIALVQRGTLDFSVKHQNAEDAGAVGCLVYNNTTGVFGMDMTYDTATTPCAAITMADGDYLIAAQQENPEMTISFPEEPEAYPSEYAYQMSEFSSKGPAPDLTLALDITAPGGNIYSTVDGGEYAVMSGTSMAAPNVAGMSAVVMQYVKDNFPEGTDYRALVQSLLTSTSVPLTYDEETGIAYSPRSQGSGLANVYNAVVTNAYLTVDGAETAKADLGDNTTGVFDFSYNVHNFGDSAAFYDLAVSAQTEDYAEIDGNYFMASTPAALSAATASDSDAMVLTHDVDDDDDADSHDAYWIYQAVQGTPEDENWTDVSFRYDTTADDAVAEDDVQAYLDALVGNESVADLADEVLMVGAGETAVVDVNVTLSDEDKTYFETYFVNGGYVEGFAMLSALHTDGVDLSLPYLGFYGDWTQAPILDDGSYWQMEVDEENNMVPVGNQYPHLLFSDFEGDEYGIYPGLNPYLLEDMDIDHISVSPNGDGYVDMVTDIYLSLMRNASNLTLRYSNMETGEVYQELSTYNIPKSVYYSSYGQIVPFTPYLYMEDVELYDWSGLKNNDKVLIEAEVVGVNEGDEMETWSVPVTVDLEKPELTGAKRTEDLQTGEVFLELSFRDNVSTAAVILVDAGGTRLYAMEAVEDVEPDAQGYQNYTKTFDITGLSGKIMIILGDYAVNESYYAINLGGEGTPYGDLVAYQYNYNTSVNGWVSFDANVNEDETTIFTSYEMDFVAAEYVNGYVYAQTDDGKLYGFRYEDMLNNTLDLEPTYITTLDNVYQDLAYSYAEGKLFGLYTYEYDDYPTSEVYSINLKGEYYDEDMYTNVMPYQEDWLANRGGLYGLTLAIDDAGTMYVLGLNYDGDTEDLTETAHLWAAEREVWGSYVDYYFEDMGDTGLSMDFLQSMTWDHNAEKLYWARFDGAAFYTVSELIEVDPETAECTKVGTLSGETCALFAPLTEDSAAKEAHANVPETDSSVIGTPVLRDSAVTMNVGGTKTLVCDFDPWYTDHKELVWTTSNTDVVTVDDNGTITAVGSGSATVTAANKADPENYYDTVSVEVTALDLKLEGIVSTMGSGVGNTYNSRTYTFEMVDGISSMIEGNSITASEELSYGLSLAASELGRGSIWACEYGNTGMIYEIDAATGEVKDVLMPVDGDMLYGMTYSESMDTFAGIMNYYLYVDMPFTHEQEQEIQDSYNEETHEFTWHRINMLPYLNESNNGFVTGENGQGASSEIVFTGITSMEGGYFHEDTYKDYLGGWDYSNQVTYTADQTLVLLDNVGRLWYIDEITGMTKSAEDDWGNAEYTNANGSYITRYGSFRNGVFEQEIVDDEGNVTYNLFNIRKIDETPLTDMFREGSMPRITYHFSDIELAGYSAEGVPMFALSLYDYWNNGTTNELYLYVPGVGTGEWVMDFETGMSYEVMTESRFYSLGNTGEHNIIATIHSAEVTGGVDPESTEESVEETVAVNKLAAGLYSR